jgi:cytochrome c oxidase subunit 4
MTGTRSLWLTWIGLLVLLAITATSSRFHLGGGNIVISLAVAATKTALIMLVFMHLARHEMLPRLIVLGIGVWLAILYGLSAADYVTR